MNKYKFKDKCDNCNNIGLCRGFGIKVLCEECIKDEINKPGVEIKGDTNEQTRINF